MNSPTRLLWALLPALCLAVAGCTRELPLGSPGAQERVPPIAYTTLWPLATRSGAYQITEGKGVGDTIEYALKSEDGRWHLQLKGKTDVILSAQPDGSVQIEREDDAVEAVTVTYSPPLVIPAILKTGKPFEGTSDVVIRRQSDAHIREQGTCSYKVELLGRQTLTTPAGEFDAYVVRTIRTMKLRLARVKVVIFDAYVPNQGEVAERIEQTVRPLYLMASTTREERRLLR